MMFHVIDDNLIGGKNTAAIINLFSEKPMLFSSALEYLEYASSSDYQKPKAIFTDVLMFNMNGYELIEKILAIHPDQRFVIMSGRPDLEHPFKNRACSYLSKPFHPMDVKKIILELEKCEQEGPSPEALCAITCGCSLFTPDNWSCPHSA